MNQAAECIDSATVRIQRLLPGPIERVWGYLTRPDLHRTWLGESASELCGVTRVERHRSIEFSMRDSSVVSLELKPHGSDVMLVLTHRRVPAWLAGAGTVVAVALLVFSFCRPQPAVRPRPLLGYEIIKTQSISSQSKLGLNYLHLRPNHFTVC